MDKTAARFLDKIVLLIAERMIKTHPGVPLASHPDLNSIFSPRRLEECYFLPRDLPDLCWSESGDFRFRTPLPCPYPENNTVYGHYFHADGVENAPVVILLHGWMMKYDILYRWICLSLSRRGLDAVLFELPFHRRRAPRGTFSGQYFVSGNMASTFCAFRQAVAETESLINWAKEKNPSRPLGILGMSLGGWLGAVMTILEPRLSFSILAAPAADPALMRTESFLGRKVYPGKATAPANQKEAAEIMRAVTPRYFDPAIGEDRILLTENRFDCFIPPRVIADLRRSWGNVSLKKYPHGHISVFFSRTFKKDIAEFIEAKCA